MTKQLGTTPATRTARIVSSTLLVLGLITFLVFTWNDYSEQNIANDPNPTRSLLSEDLLMLANTFDEIKSRTSIVSHQERPTTTLQALPSHAAAFNVQQHFTQIIHTSPVVLFMKSSQDDSRLMRDLLQKEYEISPEIAVVDLDKHTHGAALQDYIRLNKLDNRGTAYVKLPYLFINEQFVHVDVKNVKSLHKDGALLKTFKDAAGENVFWHKTGVPSNS